MWSYYRRSAARNITVLSAQLYIRYSSGQTYTYIHAHIYICPDCFIKIFMICYIKRLHIIYKKINIFEISLDTKEKCSS